ncbi:alpha-L-rhamnosidase-related protein [Paenibacillus albus]|uniref:Alpha-L-rhamnosidase six-hairpin glycosidase domain-containing protein n=1 Tax=Paenibacillus albus TaxID=2495582 RepID=A0A3Q8X937_9BACL|nr:hypothetical protein [Paenibacillus albus]AZN42964.1 hypothetical protein EJC50_27145 [Paenibacillus albus]
METAAERGPQIHFDAWGQGGIGERIDFYYEDERGQWCFEYSYADGSGAGAAVSRDLVHWHESRAGAKERSASPCLVELPIENDPNQSKWLKLHEEDHTYELGEWDGESFTADSEPTSLWHGIDSGRLACGKGRTILAGLARGSDGRVQLILTELSLRKTSQGSVRLHAAPVVELLNLRVWQREWAVADLDERCPFNESLQFRIAPGEWPDIRILPAEGGEPDVIMSELLDVQLSIRAEAQSCLLEMELYGIQIVVEMNELATSVAWKGATTSLPKREGSLKLRMLLDQASMHIFAGDGEAVLSIPAPVTPGYEGQRRLKLHCQRGTIDLVELVVYGLRGTAPSPSEQLLIEAAHPVKDRAIYQSESYSIYSHRVEDAVYGEPPAYVPDRNTILSPTRAVEEFVWRKNWANDMTRVIDRGSVWHPQAEIAKLPDLRTEHATIDAAYRLALDVFYRCGSPEFARPGEEGMWTAGQFQGPGEGFGVWVRDTTHIAIRSGNLLDPAGARASLLFTTKDGFDNGVDGTAMPIVGIWDYYLTTGDLTLVQETWPNLKNRIAKLDESFDSERGLVPADQSTSNDAFPEPEAGGFCLATETYFMEAFRAMSRMGALMGEAVEQVRSWAERGELLLQSIQRQYWNDEAGYFTSGPIGSESHREGYWESAGQEMAMWPRYGIATPEQRQRILDRLPEVAMNEFGVNVFPYREETNHFAGAAWVVWTSGMAAAAGREGRTDLLMTLIAQQVRNSVMTKTFYEVIDYQTGKAWRWPGQLWHAAGFISYFYFGVLGMEYNERGMTITPAVPETLRDLRLDNLRYREAVLDIAVHGFGTKFRMTSDGEPFDVIPASLKGKHLIELWSIV